MIHDVWKDTYIYIYIYGVHIIDNPMSWSPMDIQYRMKFNDNLKYIYIYILYNINIYIYIYIIYVTGTY